MAKMYQGADVWISDCLRRRPHPSHAHLDAVLGWARDLAVGQLWLTHLDNSMDYATLAAELPDWAAPAHDGQEMIL
jgi:phosphoribosyl 1,2-cyclic phosphate phosphodiesterase